MLAPLQVLDGFGLLKGAAADHPGHCGGQDRDRQAQRDHPPGYYGPAGAPRALNLMTPKSLLKPLPAMPRGVERRVYEGETAQPLKPQLLAAALALLFADIVAVLLLQAGRVLARRAARAGAAIAAAGGARPACSMLLAPVPGAGQRATIAPARQATHR